MKIDASFKLLTITVFAGVILAFISTAPVDTTHLTHANLGGLGNSLSLHQIKDTAKALFERAAAYAAVRS